MIRVMHKRTWDRQGAWAPARGVSFQNDAAQHPRGHQQGASEVRATMQSAPARRLDLTPFEEFVLANV
jgi:hypothetical protein